MVMLFAVILFFMKDRKSVILRVFLSSFPVDCMASLEFDFATMGSRAISRQCPALIVHGLVLDMKIRELKVSIKIRKKSGNESHRKKEEGCYSFHRNSFTFYYFVLSRDKIITTPLSFLVTPFFGSRVVVRNVLPRYLGQDTIGIIYSNSQKHQLLSKPPPA